MCESGDIGRVELLVLDRGEPAQGTVATLPVVEDLQVLKDRVGELDPGGPPLTVEEFGLHAAQKDSMTALSWASQIVPIEGSRPVSLARWVAIDQLGVDPPPAVGASEVGVDCPHQVRQPREPELAWRGRTTPPHEEPGGRAPSKCEIVRFWIDVP
jgi:hypothetical protein